MLWRRQREALCSFDSATTLAELCACVRACVDAGAELPRVRVAAAGAAHVRRPAGGAGFEAGGSKPGRTAAARLVPYRPSPILVGCKSFRATSYYKYLLSRLSGGRHGCGCRDGEVGGSGRFRKPLVHHRRLKPSFVVSKYHYSLKKNCTHGIYFVINYWYLWKQP